MDASGKREEFAAVASCVPTATSRRAANNNRAVCASTDDHLAAPCDEKYIDEARR